MEPVATHVAKIEHLESVNTTVPEIQEVYKRSKHKSLFSFSLTLTTGGAKTCAEGPYYKYYTKKGYLFRPPIRYKTVMD